jgi:hypothetical protein
MQSNQPNLAAQAMIETISSFTSPQMPEAVDVGSSPTSAL